MDSQIEQLERLAALHRAGSLTNAEYEAQKARVLGGQTTGFAPRAVPPPIDEAQLSTTWQRRFAFFRAHGSAYSPSGMQALKQMPFGTATSIRMNFWAFFFGPFYFGFLGLWKRCASLLAFCFVLNVVLAYLLGDGILRAIGFGEAALFATTANYYYFIRVTQGRDEWNPIKDLLPARGSAKTNSPGGDAL